MAMKNVLRDELIGHPIEITLSKNKDIEGMEGTIIDETKNMLIIETKDGRKKAIKDQIRFTIQKDGKKILVDGSKISFRPEDRIKKVK